MYVAAQVFTVGCKGSKPRKVMIGDPVPEVEKWDDMTRTSHLNMGWIRLVPGDYPVQASGAGKPKPSKKPAKKTTQETTPVDQAS